MEISPASWCLDRAWWKDSMMGVCSFDSPSSLGMNVVNSGILFREINTVAVVVPLTSHIPCIKVKASQRHTTIIHKLAAAAAAWR